MPLDRVLIGYWRATPFITGLLLRASHPAGFPAHNGYDRPAIAAPATVRAGRPRVYDRPAAAISAPAAVRAGRPDATDFEFFISFYCKTTIGQGLFEVCNIATRYAYESF